MMVLVGETLIGGARKMLNFEAPLNIPNTPFFFRVEVRPRDEENHFPVGSLKILPYMSDYDPQSPAAIKHVLTMLHLKVASHCKSGRKTESPSATAPTEISTNTVAAELREKLLKAHKKAINRSAYLQKEFSADKRLAPPRLCRQGRFSRSRRGLRMDVGFPGGMAWPVLGRALGKYSCVEKRSAKGKPRSGQ